ncbi:hypothetical protein PAHAL_9G374100 [Panicum hallii]|uniref:Uncharacterized protein n=1 Tax=Panicum hallii TaxID=206008 RepID=A0A2S3IPC8_9POAL|nr:hypothetical protein PAHAL_9G374100 [Panicum hallii]
MGERALNPEPFSIFPRPYGKAGSCCSVSHPVSECEQPGLRPVCVCVCVMSLYCKCFA